MAHSENFIPALVSSLAIKSRRDLVFKPLLFFATMLGLVGVLEKTLMPPEDQQTIIELLPMMSVSSAILGTLFFTILTHQHRLHAELSALVLTDELTGMPNRRAFLERLIHSLEAGQAGWVLILDADHFKRINDTHGHSAGDSCLIAIADQIQAVTASDDVTGRLGGEEFAIFLHGHSEIRLQQVCAALTKPIDVTLTNRDRPVLVSFTLSIGAAEAAQSLPMEKLLRRADQALYAAKTEGRATKVDWHPMMEDTGETQIAALH